ncbi:ASCH domain-containing protein [Microbacterium halophytorum]|uniref:ASCH domain-containing protein n=1 Tax=Microbacterium halophytorum TaxID=2067568 RepID=UPI000CFD8F9A|nr:ASCH domain-containing protein [Microbacterium halophytorum]
MQDSAAVEAFWSRCRDEIDGLPVEVPEAWPFGATPEHADGLLALVLDGVKTATASSLWDVEALGEELPAAGTHSIILDGSGAPRALLETMSVEIVPFDEVGAEHARAEGEGDRTLAYWREVHEHFWRTYAENPKGFDPKMPVVCESFRLLRAESADAV